MVFCIGCKRVCSHDGHSGHLDIHGWPLRRLPIDEGELRITEVSDPKGKGKAHELWWSVFMFPDLSLNCYNIHLIPYLSLPNTNPEWLSPLSSLLCFFFFFSPLLFSAFVPLDLWFSTVWYWTDYHSMTLWAYCAALPWILQFNLLWGLVLSDHHNYSPNLTLFLCFAPTQHTTTSLIHPIHIVMVTEIYLRGLAYSHGQFSIYEPKVWCCYQICQPLTFVTVFPQSYLLYDQAQSHTFDLCIRKICTYR